MDKKCEICDGPKKRLALSHSTGWRAHDVADCLKVLKDRIAALEVRHEELVVLLPPPDEELDIPGRGHVLLYNQYVARSGVINQRIRVEGKEYLVVGVEGALTLMGQTKARHGVGLIVIPRGETHG